MCCNCCLLRNCCCCLSLKCGTIFAGIFSLVYAALNAVTIFLSIYGEDKPKELPEVTIIKLEDYDLMLWVNFAIYATYALFAILLLVGVCKRTRGCLVPWMIISIILLIIAIIQLVLFIIALIDGQKMDGKKWSNLALVVLGNLFNLHMVQVVYSYFHYRMGEPDDYVV